MPDMPTVGKKRKVARVVRKGQRFHAGGDGTPTNPNSDGNHKGAKRAPWPNEDIMKVDDLIGRVIEGTDPRKVVRDLLSDSSEEEKPEEEKPEAK